MSDQEQEQEFSFKGLFVPLTTLKAIHFIVIIGFIVFFSMLFNGFVWDDKSYMINNPAIHSLNIFDLFRENLFNIGGNYRPIPAIYFAILYSLFTNHPFIYHSSQLTIHIINTILLFVFLNIFLTEMFHLIHLLSYLRK